MNSLKCPRCGLVNFATAAACKRCEEPLDASQPGAAYAAAPSLTPPHQGEGLYYTPSGEVPLLGALGALGGGLLGGIVLAFVYSYLVYYIPIVYLNVLCTLGYAAGLGFGAALIMRWGKVRNTAAATGLALLPTLASYYVSWAVWVSLIVSSDEQSVSALELARQPALLLELIVRINEVGAWTMFKATFAGIPLWIVWGIEALIILVGSPIAAYSMMSADPFCERCHQWCTHERGLALVGAAEEGEFKRRMEAKDFQYLREVGLRAQDDVEWYRVDLHHCAGCGQTNALSIQKEKLTYDSKGNSSVNSSSLIDKLLLSVTDTQNLRAASRDATQPQPAYA
jgi:phage FluMu protein Com